MSCNRPLIRSLWRGRGCEFAIFPVKFPVSRETGRSGSVVNLAARRCGEANAGQILVDRKVFMAIEELADVEATRELNLKGFHRPVQAYDVRALRS
jgi:class 3 adenylate cyclase